VDGNYFSDFTIIKRIERWQAFPNIGERLSNIGKRFHHIGKALPNLGRSFPNLGKKPSNIGRTFPKPAENF
jgi:hypothetical protein